MKFGVREICDVVLKAKAATKIGNKIFYANEPVIYFDTLKTSSMEGAATTVYAQGGRGNSRLVAWEGERTVTFTMEDALISPEGFMILSGAGLIEASDSKPVYQHVTETIDGNVVTVESDGTQDVTVYIPLSNQPYLPSDKNGNYAYVMFMKDGDIISEPYIPEHGKELTVDEDGNYVIKVNYHDCYDSSEEEGNSKYIISGDGNVPDITTEFDSVLVDYYVERQSDAQQIEITADKFGGNYYLEASTLFRDQNGVDLPAEFIIPNCKIQSNFTFTMASSGDPSTFTFTMDAFPDYTRFDHSKKVLAAIQIIKDGRSQDLHRHSTSHEVAHEALL
jgi:hypothetical protein